MLFFYSLKRTSFFLFITFYYFEKIFQHFIINKYLEFALCTLNMFIYIPSYNKVTFFEFEEQIQILNFT